jgi:uridine kinase
LSGTPDLLAAALREIRARPAPKGWAGKIVAIDGPGGAGKTSLAAWLATALGGAPVLHTDDFAVWENPTDWWHELLEQALKPLAAGKPARFTPADWGGEARHEVTVEPAELILLEGVSASRKEFRPYLTYAVWVDAPAGLRLERGLARGGLDTRERWEKWMADEDAFFARERLREQADLVLPGDRDLWR